MGGGGGGRGLSEKMFTVYTAVLQYWSAIQVGGLPNTFSFYNFVLSCLGVTMKNVYYSIMVEGDHNNVSALWGESPFSLPYVDC